MIESEAKTKWCPMARISGDGQGYWYSTRDSKPNKSRMYCLGPQCACWVDTGYDDDEKERTGRCGLAR